MTATTMAIGLPSNIIVSSNEQQTASNADSRIRGWLGRGVSVVGNGFSAAAHGVVGAAQKVISSIQHIVTDAPMTAGVFRKLDQHVLRMIEHLNDAPGSLSRFQLFIKRNVAFIDFVQLASDIHYFATGCIKETINSKGKVVKEKDNNIMVAARFSAFAANIGGTLLWFGEMGFLSLNQAAVALGEVRLFSFVPKVIESIPVLKSFTDLHKIANVVGEFRVFGFLKHVSCTFLTLRALDFMYAFFAIDAARRLLSAESQIKAISAGLDLSSYLAELTLSAILMAGVTNVVGLGVVGATCITLAVSSFLYKTVNDREIKRQA